jgi:hypothetical protein
MLYSMYPALFLVYRALTSSETLAVPGERISHALAEATIRIAGRIAI